MRVYGADETVGVARVANLTIYVERDIPEREPHLDWLEGALDDAVAAHGHRSAHLHVVYVNGRTKSLSGGPRAAFTRLARNFDGKLGGAAFVVAERGFGSSVVRSVITGILMVVSPKSPTRSFERLDEAVAWLEERCGHVPEEADVERAIDALREP